MQKQTQQIHMNEETNKLRYTNKINNEEKTKS